MNFVGYEYKKERDTSQDAITDEDVDDTHREDDQNEEVHDNV